MSTFNEKLICSVQKRRSLWDPKDQDYKHRQEVKRQWKEVAAELKSVESVVRTRWTTMRDRYRKESKKHRSSLGDFEVRWNLFKLLDFLKPTMLPQLDIKTEGSSEYDDGTALELAEVELGRDSGTDDTIELFKSEMNGVHNTNHITSDVTDSDEIATDCFNNWVDSKTVAVNCDTELKYRHMEEMHHQQLQFNNEKHALECEILRVELSIKKRQLEMLEELHLIKKSKLCEKSGVTSPAQNAVPR